MFFPVTDYFEIQLNNSNTVYTITQDCFVFAAPFQDDYDKGAFVKIDYTSRPPYTPGGIEVISNSGAHTAKVFFAQAGDRVILDVNGPTACKVRIMHLCPRPV